MNAKKESHHSREANAPSAALQRIGKTLLAADARLGSTNVMEVKNPQGETFKQSITYRDIEPPKKLVFTWDWQKFSASGEKVDEARDTLMTVEFQPRGTFTEVILTHEGLATPAQREAHSKGWNGCFDRLEEELKA
jgi:uncharacterized protein YndB with AHSA1/START domain